ncbi:MAG: hypothetical protein B7X46_11645 [Thiomonas sp. 15-66-11]|jgi:anti-anti-sigma regulatory factor|nr:MAG: hypothetical protein B7X46_11645 [Thiomonas sp. 15-66-11]
MSDTKPRSFWGRVTEFVKNPTQDWSLTRHENALRELQEQEQVKAKEEQRKLDAFIRRRELASLRRLRKRQADGLPLDEGYTDIPDTGTGTGPSAPEREATLRKINEIEQSMVQDSKPGLRAKSFLSSKPAPSASALAAEGDAIRLGHGEPPPASPASAAAPGDSQTFPTTNLYSRTGGAQAADARPRTQGDIDATVPAPTQMAPTQMANAQSAGTLMGLGMTQIAAELPPMDTWMKTGGAYASSSPMAVDVQEGVSSSPLFDQACIDFANGHDRDAERALLDAISGSPDRELENEFWLALFDLYRASHDTAKFEALVNDYVDRFQTSAPSWGGMPVQVHKAAGNPPPAASQPAAPAVASTFTALGEFDAAQSRALLLLARGNVRQVALDFTGLTGIAPGAQTFAMEALKTLNAANGCAIELIGIGNLIDACAASAPPMQRDADPAWWGLRLEALRLAGEQEHFENAALDYCVTYEISPPTWEPSRAKVRVLAAEAGAGISRPGTQPSLQHPSSQFSTHFGNTGPGAALAALHGEIKGGSEDFLRPLDQAAKGHNTVIVDLSDLRRLDFASAGIMLNWVMSQSSAGRAVQFEGTHRLIAGLFIILGINSVAQIQLRKF